MRHIDNSDIKHFFMLIVTACLLAFGLKLGLTAIEPQPAAAQVPPDVVWVNDDYSAAGANDGHNWGIDAFDNVEDGINGVGTGGTVNVYPGDYQEQTSGCSVPGSAATYTFGLHLDHPDHDGLAIQGVDDLGNPITSVDDVAANVSLYPTNSFGLSGVFVYADNVTMRGLRLAWHPDILAAGTQNKLIEVVGNNFTLEHCHLDAQKSAGIYIGDWRFDEATQQSYIQSYALRYNIFDQGSIALANGAGHSGEVDDRIISGNTLDGKNDLWYGLAFTGQVPEPLYGWQWRKYPCGAAIVSGNTFLNNDVQIMSRGFSADAEFDWPSYWDDNTFDRAVAVGPAPLTGLRPFSDTNHVNEVRIAGTIQGQVDRAETGDTVLAASGIYTESVSIDKKITLRGAGKGIEPDSNTVIDATGNAVGIDISAGGISENDRLLIESLRVQNSSGRGIRLNGVASHIALDDVAAVYNHYEGMQIDTLADVQDLRMSNVDFSYNTGDGCESFGLLVKGKIDGLVITDSTFIGNGIGLYSMAFKDETVAQDMTDIEILNSTFRDNYKGMYFEKLDNALLQGLIVEANGSSACPPTQSWAVWPAGIDVNLKYADYQSIQILDSWIADNGTSQSGNGVGITVKARDDGSTYGADPASLDGLHLRTLTVYGNQHGIRLGEPGKDNIGPEQVDITFNRIVGNIGSGLVNESQSNAQAENNWWGCNAGPGSSGCDSVGNNSTGTVGWEPWLTLGLSASPSAVEPGNTSVLTADLTHNSDQADSSGEGYVPDGIPTRFGANPPATVSVTSTNIVNGQATSTFTAGPVTDEWYASTTVDNQTVTLIVSAEEPDTPIIGLTASNSSPTELGSETVLMAQIDSGTNVDYTWDFGDNSTPADGIWTTHVYPAAGSFTATVTASNTVGMATAETVVTIVEPTGQNTPIAGLNAKVSNSKPFEQEKVTFTASVTGGSNVSYSWVFADGTTGEGATINHAFLKAGTYEVLVIASNPLGIQTTTIRVVVQASGPAPTEHKVFAPFLHATQ